MIANRKLSIVYSQTFGSHRRTVELEIPVNLNVLDLLTYLPACAVLRPLSEIASILGSIDWDAISGVDIEHAIEEAVEELDG